MRFIELVPFIFRNGSKVLYVIGGKSPPQLNDERASVKGVLSKNKRNPEILTDKH